jgi:hypothetical protein
MTEETKPVCGIIMPISHTDELHTEDHWLKVKSVIDEAIRQAGCTPQPVWENGGFDVIQAKILQNIYENEIVVCDISTRNPNVMLEWGMRLTTKKPTLVIAERGTPLPFDTGVIDTIFYEPALDWPSATTFITDLSKKIRETLALAKANKYTSYVAQFTFETVTPSTVSVTTEQRVEAMFEQILATDDPS